MPYGEDTLKVNIIGDASKLKGALDESSIGVAKFAEKVGSVGKTMAVVGLAVTAVSVGLIKMASDAEETASKFSVVFQDVSEAAAESAKNLSDNFGLSSVAAKQLLGDTGDLLTGFGFTGKAALDLSSKVNELAVDLASFTNYSGGAEGASRALTKALLGERESVKSLGISIMEVDVQAKILELTQQGLTFETERQSKAIATLTLMQEQSKNAIGDFARTSESFANQMRILKARVSDLAVALGEKLLPMATAMVKKAVEIVEKMKEWVEAHPKLVEWVAKLGFTLGIIAAVGGPILMAAAAFMKVKTVIDSVTFALKFLNIRMGATTAVTTGTLVPSLVKIKLALGTLGTIATGPIGIVAIAVGGLYAAWKTNLFGMRDITEQAINNIRGNFTQLEDSLAGGGGSVGAFADEIGDLGNKLKETETKLDEFGNKIETFDEWVQRLADESEKANKEMADAAEDAYERYENAMQPIEDRLYELSHTEEEVATRKLQLEREKTEATIKGAELGKEAEEEALRKVKEVYEKDIAIIIKTIEEKKQKEIEAAKTTEETAAVQERAIHKIGEKWDELIGKVNAYTEAVKKAAQEEHLESVPTIGETGYSPDYLPSPGETPAPTTQPGSSTKGGSTYSPTVQVTVQGDGNAKEIKKAVEQALDESARQYNRRGFEMVPGIG